MKPIISIIMPVYKVERYLSQAIDSILAQTMMDFELILVEDGSPDNCGKICDEYAVKDARIHVIHQENQGVSVARNQGLKQATGKYIGFIDADDWVEPIMLERMCQVVVATDSDMVICDYREEFTDGEIQSKIETLSTQTVDYSGISAIKETLMLPSFCCIRIIKRSCISGIEFQKGIKHAEDLLFLILVLDNISKVTYLDQKLYAYRIRCDSAVQRPFYEEFLDSILISEYCIFKFLKKDVSLKNICYFRMFRSLFQAIGKFEKEPKENLKNIKPYILFVRERVHLYNNSFLINPYISIKFKCMLELFLINPSLYFYTKPIFKKILRFVSKKGKI